MRHIIALVLLAAMENPLRAQGIINTIAGSTWTFPNDGRLAINAPLASVTGIALDSKGNLFVADPDNAIVVKFAPGGRIEVVAGNGVKRAAGDFGPAVNASLHCPDSIALDSAGNLYIADRCEYQVRRVNTEGMISTVVGIGYGSSPDGIPAVNAQLKTPLGIAVDSSGNLYISEAGNETEGDRVRMVDRAGIITTIAGTGKRGFAGDGGPATAALVSQPSVLAVDPQGNIAFSDQGGARIRRFRPGGTISTIAGGGTRGDDVPATEASIDAGGIAFDASGTLYIADVRGHRVRRVIAGIIVAVAGTGLLGYSGDGGSALLARLARPAGIAVESTGRAIYVSDTYNHRVRRINAGNFIDTIAGNGRYKYGGDGGAATAAFLNQPHDVIADRLGNVFIADTLNHRIRRISNGIISTYAGSEVAGFAGDGGPAARAQLCEPAGLAIDSTNNLYIADTGNSRVRMVSPDGRISTVAGSGSTCGGNPGPAGAVVLASPVSLAFDSTDALYIAETFRIRQMGKGGFSVVAGTGSFSEEPSPNGVRAAGATLSYVGGVAVDSNGIVYFGQKWSSPSIRMVDRAGILGTAAGPGIPGVPGDGGPALRANVNPAGLRIDASGNLLVADDGYNLIRRIAGGNITRIAGGGEGGAGEGDGGSALTARLVNPQGVAADARGVLYIADTGAERIRVVSTEAPPFQVSTTRLDFEAKSGGEIPPGQTVQLTSSIAGLAFTVSPPDASWVSVRPASGVMPATLLITVDPTARDAGTLSTDIRINVPVANLLRIVTVNFRVAPADEPRLAVSTDFIGIPVVQGSGAVLYGFDVRNNGRGTLPFNVQAQTTQGGAWLEVSPASGSVSANSPQAVSVRATPGSLLPGTYTGLITVTSSGSPQPIFIGVKLIITGTAQAIVLSQSGLSFQATVGATALASQLSGVVNSGIGRMNWTGKAATLSGGNWLSITPSSGSSGPAGSDVSFVHVKADPAGLVPGDYYGQVTIEVPDAVNSPQTVSVQLTILAAGTVLRPDVQPTGLIFVAGQNAASQSIVLTNYGADPITFRSSRSGTDFQFQPQNGTISNDQPVHIVVTSNAQGQSEIRRGSITLEFSDGTTRLIDILTILPPGGGAVPPARNIVVRANGCSPRSLNLVFTLLGQAFTTVAAVPTALQVRVADDCGTFLNSGTVSASFSNGDRPLTFVSTGNGHWDGTWSPSAAAPRVRIRVDALSQDGALRGFLEITGGVDPNATTPVITGRRIVNAASPGLSGPVAPGTLISIFGERLASSEATAPPGALPTQLSDALVVLKGIALPLLYASPAQINAMVPFEILPNTNYQLFVQKAQKVALPADVIVSPAQPAIFTVSGTGAGQGSIITPNGVLVDSANRVQAGATISIYASGLGMVRPPVPTGAPSPAVPLSFTVGEVKVTIGGRPATVTFSGLAPTFAGLYQINAVVPEGVVPGDAVPVTIAVGDETSPTVTIAVR